MTDRTPAHTAALPSLARLHETRLKRWHQNGEALLSFENLRSWLNAAGLVLFAPRPQIAAPAPSLAEAVLGGTTPAPALEQTAEARALLTRMIAEGAAVPLNLLGVQGGALGETPDFVASAAVFSYIFTLRGDKAWKQPPSPAGTNKVSQLAAHAYEVLAKSGPRSAPDLAQDLGNAVTEAAVLRALGELWTHLRVLPLPQADGRPTLWELASARYTKQIKAGANAGQPSALSALVSLYLGQVAVATEEDIEIFLSPLAPRSRIRDVIHALTAARQLDTVAIEGRTMVHIAGEAPEFLTAPAEGDEREGIAVEAAQAEDVTPGESQEGEAADAAAGERIKKFVPKPRKVGTGYLAKGSPVKGAAKPFGAARPFGAAKPFAAKPFAKKGGGFRRPEPGGPGKAGSEGRPERERRPFQKPRPEGGERPRFDRPWDEERPKRTAASETRERTGFRAPRGDADRPPRENRGNQNRGEAAKSGWKPAFGRAGDRERPREGERRGRFGDSSERPARSAKGPGGAAKRPFRRAEGQGEPGAERPARPFRRFDAPRPGGKRPFAPRTGEGAGEDRPRKTFRPRPEGGREDRGSGREPGERRPAKFASKFAAKFAGKFAAKRPGARREGGYSARPRTEGESGARPRREGGFGARPPREGGFSARPRREGGFSSRPPRPAGGDRSFGAKDRSFGTKDRPSGARDRPSGAKNRSFGAKGTSGKRPAKRTFKRREDESA